MGLQKVKFIARLPTANTSDVILIKQASQMKQPVDDVHHQQAVLILLRVKAMQITPPQWKD